jgi:hypothetical protein
LQLSGLVVKEGGKLRVYNPIYAAVFDEGWIDAELGKLCPYAENFRAWVASGKADKSRLLRGEALEEAEKWEREKSLSGEDQDFIHACHTRQREEEIAAKEWEAKLKREKEAREAAEKAEKTLFAANQQAQRQIHRGSLILAVAIALAAFFGVLAIDSGKKMQDANQQIEENKSLNEYANELSSLIVELYKRNNKNKLEAANHAIVPIILSFTIHNKPEFQKALLKSSIALAYLYLDNEKEASSAIEESINIIKSIKSKPDLLNSDKGKPIVFFSYAVRGNLLEEQNPDTVSTAYEKAFRYAEKPFRAAPNFDLKQDEVVKQFTIITSNSRFRVLATACLKKHNDFLKKKANRAIERYIKP